MAIQEILFYASIVCFVLAAVFIGLAVWWFFAKNIRDVMDDLNGKKLAADVERESKRIGKGDRGRSRHEPSATVKSFVQASAPEEKWRTGGSKSSGWSDSGGSSSASGLGGSVSGDAISGGSSSGDADSKNVDLNDDLYETDILSGDTDLPVTQIWGSTEDDAVTSAPASQKEVESVSAETFQVIDKIILTDSTDYITAV